MDERVEGKLKHFLTISKFPEENFPVSDDSLTRNRALAASVITFPEGSHTQVDYHGVEWQANILGILSVTKHVLRREAFLLIMMLTPKKKGTRISIS